MKTRELIVVGLLTVAFADAGLTAEPKDTASEILGQGVCSSSEKWVWPKDNSISAEVIREFTSSIATGGSRIRGFSEALALRRMAETERNRAFSEYWMSRSLYTAGLFHLAEKGFSALLNKEPNSSIVPIQIAALGCLSAIHKKVAGIPIDKKFVDQLTRLNAMIPDTSHTPEVLRQYIWEGAFYLFLGDISYSPKLLNLLKGSGPYEALCLAMMHSTQDRFDETLRDLKKFFSMSTGLDFFKPYLEKAHLIYGRAAYALGNFSEADVHYQAIRTRSNEWVHSLSELSWSLLMDEKYREAIGIAIGLQSGGLKKAFAPEALMVMAMSLNEMCRFPESMSVIQLFRKNYRDSYYWLKKVQGQGASDAGDYYHEAIEFAKKSATSKVPSQVASEWIRSAVFQANQERINLLFLERDKIAALSQQGKLEQRAMAIKVLEDIKKVRKKIKLEMIKAKPGEGLSQAVLADFSNIRLELKHFRHFKSAAPIWRKVLAGHESQVPVIQKEMVAGINQEISRLNERMTAQLQEISENNELIEVEILNGASEDIIWQNAHPGYKDAMKTMKVGSQAQAEKVWDWGTNQGGLNGRGEIWEDEIGSLQANLVDNCESKDKYLAVNRGPSS